MTIHCGLINIKYKRSQNENLDKNIIIQRRTGTCTLYITGIFSGLYVHRAKKGNNVWFTLPKKTYLPNIQNSSLSFCRLPSWQLVVVIVFNHHFCTCFGTCVVLVEEIILVPQKNEN